MNEPTAPASSVAADDAIIPAQLPTFDAIPLSPDTRKAIDALGYVNPTPVQIAVFEPAIRGKNLVVQARTGTGKTAAFGLPLVDSLVKKSIQKVQALVLTPTRELALQVAREIEKLGKFKGIEAVAIYGGAPMGKQIEQLETAQIVVGTPGRVLDHLRRGTFDPSMVRIFVLDEADEMLSMGFAKELHAIMNTLPKDRQGLFFSATLPADIVGLATNQLKDPEFVTLSSDSVGALQIQHFAYIIPGGDKRQAMVKVIEVENPESAIIFCNTKDETEKVSAALQEAGYDAEWLNGDLEQKERERIMTATREGKLRFLVATDVAARGIDISHLTHVVNFDMPDAAESYVHRTGRTGRAGRTGTAIAMVGPKDIGNLYMLRLTYGIRPIERQLPSAGELKTRAEMDLIGFFVEAFGTRTRTAHPDDLALARRLLTHADAESIVAGLVRDHLGARAASEGDPKARAAESRRAKNPPPVPVAAAAAAPAFSASPASTSTAREPRENREPRAARPPRERERDRDRAPRAERTSTLETPSFTVSEGPAASAPPSAGAASASTFGQDRGGERSDSRDRRDRPDVSPGRDLPRRPERTREPRDSRVAHKTFTTWEPPVDADDDQPLIARQREEEAQRAALSSSASSPRTVRDTDFPETSLPGFTEEPEPATEAYPMRSGQTSVTIAEEEPGFVQIYVNVGKRDGAKPGDLQKLLTDGAGIDRKDTGRIRIRDRNSFVSVKKESLDAAVAALNGQMMGGRSIVAEPARARTP